MTMAIHLIILAVIGSAALYAAIMWLSNRASAVNVDSAEEMPQWLQEADE